MRVLNRTLVIAPLVIVLLGILSVHGIADDRTLKEFKEYAQERLTDFNDAQLSQLAKLVDKDGDGVISDAEFENRMAAVRQVMDSEVEQEEAPAAPEPPQRRSRRGRMSQRMNARLEEAGISPGQPLPDVAGLDIDGKPFQLSDLKGHFSVIVNGCMT